MAQKNFWWLYAIRRRTPAIEVNIFALLAGLLSGITGAMGLGGGTVLIIYLSLFTSTEQLKSQGINLIFFIPIALFAVIIYGKRKEIKWKLVFKITVWGILGTILGINLTGILGTTITRKIFGGLLIIIGLTEVFMKKKNK